MVQRTVESMWSRIFRVEGEPTEVWVGADDREAATKFATSLFPPPLYQLHSNGVVDGMKTFTFLVEEVEVQAAHEKQQFGVEISLSGKQEYVDTMYNGGFTHPDQAVYAAKNGYTKNAGTRPVQRTITTTYGPWAEIKETNND